MRTAVQISDTELAIDDYGDEGFAKGCHVAALTSKLETGCVLGGLGRIYIYQLANQQ